MLTTSGVCCIRETKTKTDELVTFILAGGFGIPDIKFIESSSDADMRKALWDEDCRAGISLTLLMLYSCCTHAVLILYSYLTHHSRTAASSYFPAVEGHARLRAQRCQRHARIRITRHAPQVASYYYICVPIHYMCSHATKCTAAVLILLCMRHHATTYVSSY